MILFASSRNHENIAMLRLIGFVAADTFRVMILQRFSIVFAIAALASASVSPSVARSDEPAVAPRNSVKLTKGDVALLERLTSTFLFDPRGAEYGNFTTPEADGDSSSTFAGWRVASADKKSYTFHSALSLGSALDAGVKFEKRDVVKNARRIYEKPASSLDEINRVQNQEWPLSLPGFSFYPNRIALVHAAWLHRLGADDVAALALQVANRTGERPLAAGVTRESELRESIAHVLYQYATTLYSQRNDARALEFTAEFHRIVPEEEQNMPELVLLHHDLLRRRADGRLGRARQTEPPADFARWNAKRKLDYLVGELDEVNSAAMHLGVQGPLDVSVDWRAREIMRLGETAVPRLLDIVEHDTRLCRLQEGLLRSGRKVNPVWEVAVSILRSILRIESFDTRSPRELPDGSPAPTIDSLPRDDAARIVRAYWDEYGGKPMAERMVSVLRDRTTSTAARCEAAQVLALLDADPLADRTELKRRPPKSRAALNPDLEKLREPTAAEAILGALDRDLAAFDRRATEAKKADDEARPRRGAVEDAYLFPIFEIGDRRIVAELKRRFAAAKSPHMQRKLAFACHWLGDDQPIESIAEQAAKGTFALPAEDAGSFQSPDDAFVEYSYREAELGGLISMLAAVHVKKCDAALQAIAAPTHPWNKSLRHLIATPTDFPVILERAWLNNSQLFAFDFMRQAWRAALDDTTLTGAKWTIAGNDYNNVGSKGAFGSGPLRNLTGEDDPAKFKKSAEERICDRAAVELSKLVWCCPPTHPLLIDHEQRLADLRTLLDRYSSRLRPMTPTESRALQQGSIDADVNVRYVVDFPPLGRPATADDVKQGRALFEFGGQGKLTDDELPSTARWRRAKKEHASAAVLVIQAEQSPDGQRKYGILTSQGLRSVAGNDLEAIAPLAAAPITPPSQ
jgi:hypothetical protein